MTPGRLSSFTPRSRRRSGTGDALAHAGLEYARTERLAVVPRCPFVAAYIQHHPEYQPVVETQ
ncbi:MAG: GNAT family N-acetyltransferase [Gemmatimonadales bacterium]